MTRPTCRRCGLPLDLEWDCGAGRYEWACRAPSLGPAPALSDQDFADVVAAIPEVEAARLAEEATPRRRAG